MTAGTPPTRDGPGAPCAYYMVRITRPAAEAPAPMSGLVERLGTGEKQSFGSIDELMRLITDWNAPERLDRRPD